MIRLLCDATLVGRGQCQRSPARELGGIARDDLQHARQFTHFIGCERTVQHAVQVFVHELQSPREISLEQRIKHGPMFLDAAARPLRSPV